MSFLLQPNARTQVWVALQCFYENSQCQILLIDYHEQLLSEDLELLPQLLLPLAGPEEFTDEENDKLPLDLQYLPGDKKREPDFIIRKTLVEAILLVSTNPHTPFNDGIHA